MISLIINNAVNGLQIEGGLFGNEGPIEFALDVVTGVFSFVLFAITLYAWVRRSRQPTLLLVSFGFLCFFIKQVVEALPIVALHGELFGAIMDFATLLLFFFALVVGPHRKEISSAEEPRPEASLT